MGFHGKIRLLDGVGGVMKNQYRRGNCLKGGGLGKKEGGGVFEGRGGGLIPQCTMWDTLGCVNT